MNAKFYLPFVFAIILSCSMFAQQQVDVENVEKVCEPAVKTSGSYTASLHAYAGANTLSTDMFQGETQLSLDFYFPYNIGIGLQGGFARAEKIENRSITNQQYSRFKQSTNADIYFLYRPLHTRHSLTLGVGYSLGYYSSEKLRTAENHFINRMDHGILGKVQYDYVFTNNVSIGAYLQYTNYLQHFDTQDKLTLGITVGVFL